MAAEHHIQLRLFHPAMVAYTLHGDVGPVLAIDAEIASFGKEHLDLTEYEYCLLLEAATQYGTWAQVAGVWFAESRWALSVPRQARKPVVL